MNNKVLMISLSAAIVTGGLAQAAGQGEGKGMQHMGPRHSFEELDANADGLITKDEMAAHRAERFKQADADGSGSLSLEEITAQAKERKAARMEKFAGRMIKRHDANGDGELSESEMSARHKGRMFAHMDTDQDGAISTEEFEEMKSWRKGHRKGGHDHKSDDQAN